MSTLNVNSIQTVGGASPVLTADIAKKSDFAATDGSATIGYMPAGSGAVTTTLPALAGRASCWCPLSTFSFAHG